MNFMVLLVVNDLDRCPTVLDAWEAAQVPGITTHESIGLGMIRRRGIRDDLPLMPSISDLLRGREHRHRTIFSVVEGEEKVEELIRITEGILGDLNRPHSGVMFVLPVSRVVGIEGAQARAEESAGENEG